VTVTVMVLWRCMPVRRSDSPLTFKIPGPPRPHQSLLPSRARARLTRHTWKCAARNPASSRALARQSLSERCLAPEGRDRTGRTVGPSGSKLPVPRPGPGHTWQ
jgi:hypothetical protein